jgi:hypothetical protein
VDVSTLTRQWETREEALSLEYYLQYAGLSASEPRMEQLASEVQGLATEGLAALRREDLPPLLWQALVSNRSARDLTKDQNEVYRLRNEAVKADVAGESVNLNTIRLFNAKHLREPRLRKEAFDALLARASALTPTLEARFRLSGSVWKPFGMTPLDAYLVEEQVTLPQLERTVDAAAREAGPAFRAAAEELGEEILGKGFEYYDDMYVFRHAIYAPVDPHLARVDFVAEFLRLGKRLGFRPEEISIDREAREGKFSSPVCFGVKIPGDVRVLYQRSTPTGDYESFYHEMGHAVHFASVDPRRAFHERRLIQNGVAEIFSTLFEELAMDPVYLEEDLGLPPAAVAELGRRRRFMELYFLVFYGANSMHKIRFWREGLQDDFARADKAYAELYERYVGAPMPGIYWQTHHVLSMSDVYAPSYLLANIRKSELIARLRREHGRTWWREPGAGAWLREHAMGPGASIDLNAFSRLDADAYVKPVVEGRRG